MKDLSGIYYWINETVNEPGNVVTLQEDGEYRIKWVAGGVGHYTQTTVELWLKLKYLIPENPSDLIDLYYNSRK